MNAITMAEKLWDLANLITGFAIAHALTMTYVMAKHEMPSMRDRRAHGAAALLSVIFLLLYIGAIYWCYDRGSHLDHPENAELWCSTTLGRILAVIAFHGILLLALAGHWKDIKERRMTYAK